jgi:hypothetical protein
VIDLSFRFQLARRVGVTLGGRQFTYFLLFLIEPRDLSKWAWVYQGSLRFFPIVFRVRSLEAQEGSSHENVGGNVAPL